MGAAEEEQLRRAAAIAQWKGKLVVSDPTFHSGGPQVCKAAQADRLKGILHGPAVKKSLASANVAVPPVSMFLGEVRNDIAKSFPDKGRFVEPGTDFKRMISNSKSAVAKHGVSQSWYGEMRDKNLQHKTKTLPA
jgi:hypothetical protein